MKKNDKSDYRNFKHFCSSIDTKVNEKTSHREKIIAKHMVKVLF